MEGSKKVSVYSNGILLFRSRNERLEVMLVHPGGPIWSKKDYGVWSIPKGLPEKNENPLDTAKREIREETGFEVDGKFIDLGELNQSRNKIVHVWALEKDLDITNVISNTFILEWPKNSGKIQKYPEVDRAGWFDVELAKKKIRKEQIGFIDRLIGIINCSQKEKHLDKEKRYRQTTLF
ncbi:NUDIX domain-containing protein [Methanosarcina sp.]|uniref:NUDIX domain-containing protein n=1 Tax=Methanosarcina sp. TaxID=2213 RepID=UPI00298D37FB|nr:NUDIX domain-containing protein [Methanosarcina sp.]